jgi:hybrid cluster-associated redox disulfide protein
MDEQRLITAETQVSEMTTLYPSTAVALLRMGVNCVGCWISRFHTVGDLAQEWNLDLDRLLRELNRVAREEVRSEHRAPH